MRPDMFNAFDPHWGRLLGCPAGLVLAAAAAGSCVTWLCLR